METATNKFVLHIINQIIFTMRSKFFILLFIAITAMAVNSMAASLMKGEPPGKCFVIMLDLQTQDLTAIESMRTYAPSPAMYADMVWLEIPPGEPNYCLQHYKLREPFRSGFYAQIEQVHRRC
jgi:hypothetical protein